eukprot:gnl/Dysnectes_brevis/3564_a4531_431.p1 GENE.gnl/Dysnectes_brevis/3564_a4531_431~~gnl/Dysnectes_brevis/3564_a4531_431.p1  ORF type:complete len:759 (+),score=156.70 gnl/Dysnectes_brevis/3564_a4531_431:100-2376(+)
MLPGISASKEPIDISQIYQDVFLAVGGFLGDIVVESSSGFILAPHIARRVMSSDRAVIKALLDPGYHCYKLNTIALYMISCVDGSLEYLLKSPQTPDITHLQALNDIFRTPPRSSALMALGTALQQEVISFRDTLQSLGPLSPPLLRAKVAQAATPLAPLHSLARRLLQAGRRDPITLKGGALLSRLTKAQNMGAPSVQGAVKRITLAVQRVVGRQYAAFILHGNIRDPLMEFFAQPAKGSIPPSDAAPADAPHLMPPQRVPLRRSEMVVSRRLLPPWLPDQTSTSRAVFLAWAARLLADAESRARRANKPLPEDCRPLDLGDIHEELLTALSFVPAYLTSTASLTERLGRQRGARLWRLLKGPGSLLRQLHLLQDLALHRQGDLWELFLEEGRTMMDSPPSRTAGRDLQRHFERACRGTVGYPGAQDTASLSREMDLLLSGRNTADEEGDEPLIDPAEDPSSFPLSLLTRVSVVLVPRVPTAERAVGADPSHPCSLYFDAESQLYKENSAVGRAPPPLLAAVTPQRRAWEGVCLSMSPGPLAASFLSPQTRRVYSAVWRHLLAARTTGRAVRNAWMQLLKASPAARVSDAARRRPGLLQLRGSEPSELGIQHTLITLGGVAAHEVQGFLSGLGLAMDLGVIQPELESLWGELNKPDMDFLTATDLHTRFLSRIMAGIHLTVPDRAKALRRAFWSAELLASHMRQACGDMPEDVGSGLRPASGPMVRSLEFIKQDMKRFREHRDAFNAIIGSFKRSEW